MDLFKVLKVIGIGATMVGGVCGAAAAVPELKEAMGDCKKKPNTVEGTLVFVPNEQDVVTTEF